MGESRAQTRCSDSPVRGRGSVERGERIMGVMCAYQQATVHLSSGAHLAQVFQVRLQPCKRGHRSKLCESCIQMPTLPQSGKSLPHLRTMPQPPAQKTARGHLRLSNTRASEDPNRPGLSPMGAHSILQASQILLLSPPRQSRTMLERNHQPRRPAEATGELQRGILVI